MKKIDAVFEGGGVKGIGLVGAVSVIEKAGYKFENLAGTSAGAIVAGLLAVGFNSEEIKEELKSLNYNNFKDGKFLSECGWFGKGLKIIFKKGIYKGDFFEEWFDKLLKKKGKYKFGDIKTKYKENKYKYKLQVIASDLTDQCLLVLPGDLQKFGEDPDDFSISKAIRMSMSIPIFFEPVKLKDKNDITHYIVDGGVLSNYPVWLLDDGTCNPEWPTFGFKLMEPQKRTLKEPSLNPIKNTINYFFSIIGTLLNGHDNYHISESKGDYDRTIGISTEIKVNNLKKEIGTTYFDITEEESILLFKNGEEAAEIFLKNWNFQNWKEKYRQIVLNGNSVN
jgi:NTE family protein